MVQLLSSSMYCMLSLLYCIMLWRVVGWPVVVRPRGGGVPSQDLTPQRTSPAAAPPPTPLQCLRCHYYWPSSSSCRPSGPLVSPSGRRPRCRFSHRVSWPAGKCSSLGLNVLDSTWVYRSLNLQWAPWGSLPLLPLLCPRGTNPATQHLCPPACRIEIASRTTISSSWS